MKKAGVGTILCVISIINKPWFKKKTHQLIRLLEDQSPNLHTFKIPRGSIS